MRIVSLLPSTTEIVASLGLADQLVAISHACDYPAEVVELPRVTRPAAAETAEQPALATPAQPSSPAAGPLVSAELGMWELDAEALRRAAPDLVLVGDASGAGRAQAAARAALGESDEASIVSFNPLTLEGIFNAITTIGAMTESEDEAMGLLEVLREDLGELEELAMRRRDEGVHRPRTVVLEGFDPLAGASRWVPELVRRAGGWDLLGCEGEMRRAPTTWQEILDVDPEMLILAPARMTLNAAIAAWRAMPKPDAYDDLDAVRRGQVIAVDPVYFVRPGPRIVDAVGILGEIFDPAAFVDTSPEHSWAPLA